MQTKSDVGSAPAVADDDMDEAPILTDAEVREVEVFEGNTFVRRGRGRPPTGNAKEVASFRLDRDVLAKLREAGPGWQSQVNGMLRTALGLDGPSQVVVVTPKCDMLSGAGQPLMIFDSKVGLTLKDVGGIDVEAVLEAIKRSGPSPSR